jgi:hypothetical protein
MDLSGLFADQMGMFTPYDIAGIVFDILLAAVLGLGTGRVAMIKDAEGMASWAALAALAVIFVRRSVPLSIALVGVVLLLRPGTGSEERHLSIARAAAVIIGLGCGSGAGMIALAASIPIAFVLRWSCSRSER